MGKYWYKAEKRVKRISEDATTEQIKKLKDLGYVQVSDRRNPEGSNINEIPKPKPKVQPKPKAKVKPKKKIKKKVKKK